MILTISRNLLSIYKILLLCIAILIILYFPLFSLVGNTMVALVITGILSMLYSIGCKVTKKYPIIRFYIAFVLALIIVLLSLYQIIFGDPTNWLGTGFNLTTLPKIDL